MDDTPGARTGGSPRPPQPPALVSLCSKRTHGGRSSIWLEHQVVVLGVGGSSPLGHPTRTRTLPVRSAGTRRTRFAVADTARTSAHTTARRYPRRAVDRGAIGRLPRASSSTWQSNGLLIRRFGVRIPGGPPRAAPDTSQDR